MLSNKVYVKRTIFDKQNKVSSAFLPFFRKRNWKSMRTEKSRRETDNLKRIKKKKYFLIDDDFVIGKPCLPTYHIKS